MSTAHGRPRNSLARRSSVLLLGSAAVGSHCFVQPHPSWRLQRPCGIHAPLLRRYASDGRTVEVKVQEELLDSRLSETPAEGLRQPPRANQKEKGERRFMLGPAAAVVVLGMVTVLWGSQHSIIKSTLNGEDQLEAACLNFVRFSLAAACFSQWLPPTSEDARGWRASLEWRAGVELGFWLFLGFCLQAVGLLYTTAQRSGLLLYLNVKLVPFFAFFVFGRSVTLSSWLLALVAFGGTLLVAADNKAGIPPNIGDALSIAAAAASAMFILRLEKFAPVTDAKSLNAVSTLLVASLCLPWAFSQAVLAAPPEVSDSGTLNMISFVVAEVASRCWSLVTDHTLAILYLGVLTTAFTNWLQTIGQQTISATTASAIYALDPLWGAFFAYLWLGEQLGPQGLLGCAILFGVWVYQLVLTWEEKPS